MTLDSSQIKLSNNDIKRGLVLPKRHSKELAEFVGILTLVMGILIITRTNINIFLRLQGLKIRQGLLNESC